jgi:hypothetical protein
MTIQSPILAPYDRFASLAGFTPSDPPGVRSRSTRDHQTIREWAARYQAEPATGEASSSGPATVEVRDGGSGLRFNFPGYARFRAIGWGEWFDHFDSHHLLFVYEEPDVQQVASRARALWHARGERIGHDREDWFEAEEELRREAGGLSPSARYRIVRDGAGRTCGESI